MFLNEIALTSLSSPFCTRVMQCRPPRIVRKKSGCTEEDAWKQSVDLVAGSRCDRRDRDAGGARDGFERGEQGPMPRGRWQPWPEWAHDAHNSVTRRCFRTIPEDRRTFERERRWAAPATVGPDS